MSTPNPLDPILHTLMQYRDLLFSDYTGPDNRDLTKGNRAQVDEAIAALEAQRQPVTNGPTPDDLLMDKNFAELHLIFSRALKGRAFHSELSEVIDDIKFLFSKAQEKTSTSAVPAGHDIVPEVSNDLTLAYMAGYSKGKEHGKRFAVASPASTPAPEQDAMDARRYRYIRSQMESGAVQTQLPLERSIFWIGSYVDCSDPRYADEAIDAALSAGEGEQT